MPGHKNNKKYFIKNLFSYDETEFGNMDNLHSPDGIIKKSQKLAAKVYNVLESFYLVNGSTAGIVASITSSASKTDKIIVARNSHKSVYTGICFSDCQSIYVYPSILENGLVGGINYKDIEKEFINNNNIKAVVITSPTYEGFTSNIKKIAEIVHKYNAILIVDEAHGAHFPFNSYFPNSATLENADIVIESLHKTLPTPTQTAILHVCSKNVNIEKLKLHLAMVQTSSPSYMFMVSIDKCIKDLSKNRYDFEKYIRLLINFREKCKDFKYIILLDKDILENKESYIENIDLGKLVFVYDEKYSLLVQNIFNKNLVELEMFRSNNAIAMTSVADKKIGFKRLFKAVEEIEKTIQKISIKKDKKINKIKEIPIIHLPLACTVLKYSDAINKDTVYMDINKCENLVSGDFLIPYPPGIPLLTIGELITKNHIDLLNYYIKNNQNVLGITNGKIKIINNKGEYCE